MIDASGSLVGILSEGDLLHRTELGTARRESRWLSWLVEPGRLAEDYVEANARLVEEVMSRSVHTIAHDAWLDEAVGQMERYGIKRLPVLKSGKVVGILSRSDLVRALAGLLSPDYVRDGITDAQIKAQLLAELSTQYWVPTTLAVSVKNGVVTLRGTVFDLRQRTALHVAAEAIPGVRSIRDELSLADPLVGVLVPVCNRGTA